MTRQVTILMDDDLYCRVREYQTRTMLEHDMTYSFSDAVNDLLAKGT